MEDAGLHETAHRMKQFCGRIFRYGKVTSRASQDVTADLRGALAPVTTVNHPAITDPTEFSGLLREMDRAERRLQPPDSEGYLKTIALRTGACGCVNTSSPSGLTQ